MVKSELLQKLCNMHPNVLRKDMEQILEIIFLEISEALCRGENIEIRGFGSYKIVDRKSYTGKNPKNLSLRFMARKFWRGSFLRLSNILPFYSHSIFQCRRNHKGVDRCSTFYGNVSFHVAITLRLFNALEKIYLGSSSIIYNRRMPFYSGLDSIPYPFCLPGDHSLYLPKCLNSLFNGNL